MKIKITDNRGEQHAIRINDNALYAVVVMRKFENGDKVEIVRSAVDVDALGKLMKSKKIKNYRENYLDYDVVAVDWNGERADKIAQFALSQA